MTNRSALLNNQTTIPLRVEGRLYALGGGGQLALTRAECRGYWVVKMTSLFRCDDKVSGL